MPLLDSVFTRELPTSLCGCECWYAAPRPKIKRKVGAEDSTGFVGRDGVSHLRAKVLVF